MSNYFNLLFLEIYKVFLLILPVLTAVALIVWLDRRVWAFVQKRRGPNVVGPFGLFQSLADALKYIFNYSSNIKQSNFYFSPYCDYDVSVNCMGSNSIW